MSMKVKIGRANGIRFTLSDYLNGLITYEEYLRGRMIRLLHLRITLGLDCYGDVSKRATREYYYEKQNR